MDRPRLAHLPLVDGRAIFVLRGREVASPPANEVERRKGRSQEPVCMYVRVPAFRSSRGNVCMLNQS